MPDTAEETAARGRVAAAQEIASEASRLIFQLRGLLAAADVPVPADLETLVLAWLSAHVRK